MNQQNTIGNKKGLGCLKVLLIMLVTVVVSVGLTFWLVSYYFFPDPFEPVELDQEERVVLKQKLNHVGLTDVKVTEAKSNSNEVLVGDDGKLIPTPYSEVGASREIALSEKELNALLASNTDLGDQLVIDLSDKLASASLLLPLEPDFPFLGGKTLRATAGLEVDFVNDKPVMVLKGVSVWGVPIPNAWLGGLKNVDLVNEFGGSDGFWQGFSEGLENIRVDEGTLYIKLKE